MQSVLQAIAIDIGPELVMAIFGVLLTTIGSLLIYIFNQLSNKIEHIDKGLDTLGKKFDKMSAENDSDHAAVISRIDKLEVTIASEKEEVEYIYKKLDKYDTLLGKYGK